MTSRYYPQENKLFLQVYSGREMEYVRRLSADDFFAVVDQPTFAMFLPEHGIIYATLDELPDLKLARYGEAVFDITTVIVYQFNLKRLGPNDTYDSRALFQKAHEWALEFINSDYDDHDYLTAVEEFALAKVKDYFLEEEQWKSE